MTKTRQNSPIRNRMDAPSPTPCTIHGGLTDYTHHGPMYMYMYNVHVHVFQTRSLWCCCWSEETQSIHDASIQSCTVVQRIHMAQVPRGKCGVRTFRDTLAWRVRVHHRRASSIVVLEFRAGFGGREGSMPPVVPGPYGGVGGCCAHILVEHFTPAQSVLRPRTR